MSADPFVSVGDREADVYDLFVAERAAGVDLLVRAAWDRRVAHEERYLWAAVLAQPVAEIFTVSVPAAPGPARPHGGADAALWARWSCVRRGHRRARAAYRP